MASGRLLLAILFLSLFSFNSFAQSADSTLTITVKDPSGAAVAGATVTLAGRSTLPRTAVTSSDGTVAFDNVPGGERSITVAATGFPSVLRDVTVPASALEVILSPGGVSENVTVTATRSQVSTEETAAPVTVVGRRTLEERNLNSVGEIFRSLPGTSTTNEGAFQVRPRIRGLDSNRVLVLVDGERLNNSRTSTEQSGIELGLVDVGQVESIEVVRGSGSVLYGTDALAGTVNIITRDTPARRESGFRFGATFDTLFSSNEKGRRGTLAVNGSGEWFAFRVSQTLDRFDNYFAGDAGSSELDRLRGEDLQITDDGEVLNSQSHSGNTQSTLRFFLGDTSALKFNYERRRGANIGSAGLTGPNTGVPGLTGVFNAFFPFNNRDKFNVRYDIAALTDNLQRVTAKAFYQTQYRNFTNSVTVGPIPPFFPGVYQFSETVTDTKTAGFDVQTDWTFGRHNLIAGASYFDDDNTDRRLLISASTPTSANRTVRNSRSVPDADLTNIAFFAQDEYRVTDRLRLTGGVRFDRFRTSADPTENFVIDPRLTEQQIEQLGIAGLADGLDVTNSAWTGDIGAIYNLTDTVSVSGRIGRSFRTPNISERFFTDAGSAEGFLVGNPRLVPETGINFDTTVKYRTKRFAASATYFNNYYKNFLATTFTGLELSNGTDIYQTRNIVRARIQGFEAEVDAPFRINFGYLTPYGNFSYLRGDDLNDGEPLDFISPVRANAGVRWQNVGRNYFVDYNTRIATKQDRLSDSFFASNGGAEPGFVTHNVSGGYYFRRERFNVSVNLGVSNLFDRFYREQFNFAPARGRSFTIGTTWEIR